MEKNITGQVIDKIVDDMVSGFSPKEILKLRILYRAGKYFKALRERYNENIVANYILHAEILHSDYVIPLIVEKQIYNKVNDRINR